MILPAFRTSGTRTSEWRSASGDLVATFHRIVGMGCTCCILGMGAHSAFADTAEAPEVGLEEIIVTAERRAERLQDVPIAVTALTESAIDQLGLTGMKDLSASVPGLDFTRQANGATVYLRGVGNPNGAIGQESSVAMYVDGVYMPSPAGALFSFNNIDRLEVLKGPQGTLFGRNATGGVIQVITKDPSQTTHLDAAVSYANYNTVEGTAYATTGVTSTLATDIAVYGQNRGDGWGRYTVLNKDAFTGSEWDIRNKWLWTPGENTEVRLALDAGETKTLEGLGWHALPGTYLLDGTTYSGRFYDTNDNVPTGSDDKYSGAAVTIHQNLGFARLVSITSLRGINSFYRVDQAATAEPILDPYVSGRSQTLTQEVQLLANPDNKLQWILGAFFFHDDSKYDPVKLVGSGTGGPSSISIFGDEKTNSYAGFGQASYEVLPATDLTLGLRYTEDKRSISGETITPEDGVIGSGAQSASFDKVTWRVALDHKFTPDVMGYISDNRGFKSGLYQVVSYSAPAVRPEVLDAQEVGMKTEFLDRRLRINVAGYHYNYRDLQITIVVPGSQETVNVPGAEVWGADLDFNAKPTNHLSLQGGLNYTHGRYTDFPQGPVYTALPPSAGGGAAATSENLAGNTMVHAPTLTGVIGATYRIETKSGNIDLNGSVTHNSGFFWYPDDNARQPRYDLLNAAIEWTSANGKWGVDVWGRNLSGEQYYSFVSENTFGYVGSPAAPRTFGITLKVNAF
jgi:iron complex outermembrane receptor protein